MKRPAPMRLALWLAPAGVAASLLVLPMNDLTTDPIRFGAWLPAAAGLAAVCRGGLSR